jgi:hypothetical protein
LRRATRAFRDGDFQGWSGVRVNLHPGSAREISYAGSASTRAGRVVIRSVENLTGRLKLIRMARDCGRELAEGRDFWQVMVDRYGLSLQVAGGSFANIPRPGRWWWSRTTPTASWTG